MSRKKQQKVKGSSGLDDFGERKVKPHESQLEPELRCHPATEIRVWQRRGKERQNEIKSQARRSTVWNGAPGISASLPRQSHNPALLPVTRP
jgi:hypothetical protein